MGRRIWQIVLSVACLALALALLDGCAKRATPASASTSATDAAGSRTGAGAGRGAAGAETGGLAGTDAALSTGAGQPGLAIPSLPMPAGFAETAALRDVHFEFDRYTIRPQESPALETNARWLAANPGAILLIEGHADERGTNEYNLALGERRAHATRDYLVALGIASARMTLVSYGEERPLCTERTEGCWAENRRVHFLVRQR